MFARNHLSNIMVALRWAARSLVIFCLGILLFFLLGLGLDLLYVAGEDIVIILFLLFIFLGGLVLAWLDEVKEGCALALLSVAIFYLSYGSTPGSSTSQLLWALIFTSRALLFLLYGAVSSLAERRATAASQNSYENRLRT